MIIKLIKTGIVTKITYKSKEQIVYITAYGLGLIATFCALYLMEKGQPALLYLVPFTLITTFVIGCIRGEAGALWSGVTKQVNYSNLLLSEDWKSNDYVFRLKNFSAVISVMIVNLLYYNIDDISYNSINFLKLTWTPQRTG